MSVNLTAVARLNTGPYMASLRTLAKGTDALSASGVQGAKKVQTAEQARIAANETANRQAIQSTRALAKSQEAAAKAQQGVAKGTAAASSGLAAQRYLYQDLSRQARNLSLAFAAVPIAGLAIASMWERSFADVERTADPAFTQAPERVNALRDSLVGMAQAMPASFTTITEIATLANQMGIASKDVAEFTRTVAMFSATSGVSADMAATAFGRLTSILGESRRIPFIEMADAILKVGVNSVATEDEIINVNTQISSIAAQAGFSAKEMIAMSGALASVRVPPELSRGLITRVFGQIDKAVSDGGTRLDAFARISGMTSQQVREQWGSEGAANTFNAFLHGLRDLGPAARKELENLGITSVRDVPVTLRLANAADSEGRTGELFTQTLRDANNAAGETQRQYSIMADTVVGKLKILGNNLLAFFDTVGKSDMGGFGDMLGNFSKELRNFTRDFEEPARLFNTLELPFSNSDLVGAVTGLSSLAAVVLLAGSAFTKFKAIAATMRHTRALSHLSTMFSSAGSAWKNMISSFQMGAGPMQAFANTTTRTSDAFLGATANSNRLAGSVGKLGASFKGASYLVGGPWVAAAMLAVGAISAISYGMSYAEQDTKSFSDQLASIDVGSLSEFNHLLGQISVKRNWGDVSNPFAETSLQAITADYQKMIQAFETGQTKVSGVLTQADSKEMLGKFFFSDDVKEALGQIDESFQSLVDSGNGAKAAQVIQQLGASGTELQGVFDTDKTKNMESFLRQAFAMADIQWTSDNLDQFARGQLPEVTDALFGVAGATKSVEEAFDGDFEALGQFSTAIDEAAASFINFEDALAAGAKDAGSGFNLSAFSKTLQGQIKEQEKWVSDITTISKYGSTGVIEALASMGPEGRKAASALAEGLKSGSAEAETALQSLEDAVTAKLAGFGSAIAEQMANTAWASQILGDRDLAVALTNELGDDKMSQLYAAAEGVGQETINSVLQGVTRGTVGFDAAMEQLLQAQPIKPTFDWSSLGKEGPAAIDRSMEALKYKLSQDLRINPSVELDSSTTIAEFRGMLNNPELNKLNIDGSLTLTEAYAESRAFQYWAESQNIQMLLGADDSSAKFTFNSLVAMVNGTVSQVQIDAAGDPAEGKLWDIVQQADGTTAFIEVDANGQPAEDALKVVVDKAGNVVARIRLDADTSGVEAAANQYRGSVIGTAFINIEGRGFVNASSALNHANGGYYESFANGGESHTAQIAKPNGTVRVWAEPETEGEAYIPFARSKRTRSTAILQKVANRFGYSLSEGINAAKFADGGTYELQSRSRYGRMRPDITGSQEARQIFNIDIHNPIEKDWAKDSRELAQKAGAKV